MNLEKRFKVISFKSFMLQEIEEEHKEILEQWNILVNMSSEQLKEYHLSDDFKSLSEKDQKESKYVLKLIETTEDKWTETGWKKAKNITGKISENINNNIKYLGHTK